MLNRHFAITSNHFNSSDSSDKTLVERLNRALCHPKLMNRCLF